MIQNALIGLAIYVILLPILFRLIAYLQRKLFVDRVVKKLPKNTKPKDLPKPIWRSWRKSLSFTIRDKRKGKLGLSSQQMFFLLFTVGLILTVVGFAIDKIYPVALIGVLFFWITMIYGVLAPKKILQARKKLYERLFSIANSSLRMPKEYEENIEQYIKVLEWDDDGLKPLKIEFFVADNVNEVQGESFLQEFNRNIGQDTSWVPTDEEIKDKSGKVVDIKPGWNFAENKVTINAVPPLPRMAPWHERYVLDPAIAWSFFPIALGVENGVEITNEETGETEYVLGFDVSGLQADAAKKAGVKVSDKITTSPMILVAGGTGGGKSLSLETPVFVRKTKDMKEDF